MLNEALQDPAEVSWREGGLPSFEYALLCCTLTFVCPGWSVAADDGRRSLRHVMDCWSPSPHSLTSVHMAQCVCVCALLVFYQYNNRTT